MWISMSKKGDYWMNLDNIWGVFLVHNQVVFKTACDEREIIAFDSTEEAKKFYEYVIKHFKKEVIR